MEIDRKLWNEGGDEVVVSGAKRFPNERVISHFAAPDFAPDKFINSWPATCRQEGRRWKTPPAVSPSTNTIYGIRIEEKVFLPLPLLNRTCFNRREEDPWFPKSRISRSCNNRWKFRYEIRFHLWRLREERKYSYLYHSWIEHASTGGKKIHSFPNREFLVVAIMDGNFVFWDTISSLRELSKRVCKKVGTRLVPDLTWEEGEKNCGAGDAKRWKWIGVSWKQDFASASIYV